MAAEPIHDIAHLGSVELFTPKPEKSLWYFRDLLGMEPVHQADNSVYLRGYGDYAISTLKLTTASTNGVGYVSWRAASPQALERRAKAIADAGLGIGWTNGDFGRGRSYRFRDPDGHVMEIYYEEHKFMAPPELHSNLKNLPQKYTGRGVGVRRIDHLALLAKDVEANRKFATDLLGFCASRSVTTRARPRSASPTAIHHQLAYVVDVKGAHGRLHHFSLWVDNRDDVLRAADILTENGIFLEAGPSKHNNSQGFYLYTYEPGGNRVEIYSGSFLVVAPDWEPVTWNEEERGTGTYWGAALPESFIQYATPDVKAGEAVKAPEFPVFF